MRNTAATIATVIGFVLVVESVLNLISWKPLEYVRPFLPSSAGARVATPEEFLDMTNQLATQAVDLSPWGGYAVLVGWVVVILGAGRPAPAHARRLRRRARRRGPPPSWRGTVVGRVRRSGADQTRACPPPRRRPCRAPRRTAQPGPLDQRVQHRHEHAA